MVECEAGSGIGGGDFSQAFEDVAGNTDSLSQAWQPRGGLSVMRLLLSKHEPAFNQEQIQSVSKPEGLRMWQVSMVEGHGRGFGDT